MAGKSVGTEVNRAQLAALFGISLPTVDNWVRAGCPFVTRGSKGIEWKFDSAEVIEWRRQRDIQDATGDKQQDADEIERRTKRARMRQAELELAKELGKVAPIAEFERAQAARYALIRQNVLNVPARACLRLLGCTDETEFKSVLRRELVMALETAATEQLEIIEDDEPTEADA